MQSYFLAGVCLDRKTMQGLPCLLPTTTQSASCRNSPVSITPGMESKDARKAFAPDEDSTLAQTTIMTVLSRLRADSLSQQAGR